MLLLEIIDGENINTYSLNSQDELNCIIRHIRFNSKIREIRVNWNSSDGIRWIRKMPKDKWIDMLENKLIMISSVYANRNILDGDIFWVCCKKMPSDLHNSLTLELHMTKSMSIDEYRYKCILETVEKVVLDEEFYSNIHY